MKARTGRLLRPLAIQSTNTITSPPTNPSDSILFYSILWSWRPSRPSEQEVLLLRSVHEQCGVLPGFLWHLTVLTVQLLLSAGIRAALGIWEIHPVKEK